MNPEQNKTPPSPKDAIDHTPHKLFVELQELQDNNYGGSEWRETARWIKYEENVEGPDQRWGKPHIPCLNFYSLFQLRKVLEQATLLLDLEEYDFPTVAMKVVDRMVSSNQVPANMKDSVAKILLLRHNHTKESGSAFRRASVRLTSLYVDDENNTLRVAGSAQSRRSTRISMHNIFRKQSSPADPVDDNNRKNSQSSSGIRESKSQNDFENEIDEKMTTNVYILKKLSPDAEAAGLLVGTMDGLAQPAIAFVRLAEGVFMDNFVETPIPVRFLFFLLGPYDADMDYREMGRAFGTLMAEKSFTSVAYEAVSRSQLLLAISDFLNSSIIFPPSEWRNNDLVPLDDIRRRAMNIRRRNDEKNAKSLEDEPQKMKLQPADRKPPPPPPRNPLQRHGKPFYGLIQDIKIRYSQYPSDIIDALSFQVLSTCIFIFFANLSPAITFGGIYGDKTKKFIGVGETLLATSINGVIFALFAAQPILIVGATGPLMIFDMSLLNFCKNMDLDFLSIRVWVGMWILLIGLITCAFEGVAIVKTFSRFLEEIFSSFVCLIFIYGAFENLYKVFVKHPMEDSAKSCFRDANDSEITEGLLHEGKLLNGTNIYGSEVDEDEVKVSHPNTALLSMCLMLGTFIIAFKLKHFRNSTYLSRGVRRALGDFGVPIAIFVMVLVDFLVDDTYTEKLSMPKGLEPSNAQIRGWIISPFGVVKTLPVWCMFAAAPAALLLYILIFIEENICQLILGKPERCLKKGSGFHLDIVLSCAINTVSGFLGAPFMGPACVRTIAHMSSLTVTSSNVAPGESPKIVGCIEQRISALTVSVLVGLSVMLYMVLNLVPTAVLLGIFLYMGVSATAGIQFIERIILFFMPVKYFPNVQYVRYVKAYKMHLFTAIQVVALVILWVIKQSPASLAVPFVFMCLVPIRMYLLPHFFTQEELTALDGVVKTPVEQVTEEEPDFYETAHDFPYPVERSSQSSEDLKSQK